MFGVVVTMAFCVLLFLTIIQQLFLCRDSQNAFIKNELLNIFVPGWVFFAPNPGVVTFSLLFRVRYSENNVSCWKEQPICGARRWYNWLWHPEKRLRKAFFDLNAMIRFYFEEAKKENLPDTVELTIGYLTILHYLSLRASALATEVQFIVMESDAVLAKRSITFISNWHRVR